MNLISYNPILQSQDKQEFSGRIFGAYQLQLRLEILFGEPAKMLFPQRLALLTELCLMIQPMTCHRDPEDELHALWSCPGI